MALLFLEEHVLPAIFNNGGFRFVECLVDPVSIDTKEHLLMSTVIFLTAVVESDSKERLNIALVIKLEPLDETTRKELKTNVQFFNEVFMYKEVIPFINRERICEDIFPKFYNVEGSDRNILVVENLKPLGYRLAEERTFLDYEHLSLAIKKLGQFHALSYAAKKESPEKFYDLTNRLKETTWTRDSSYIFMIKSCFHRAVDPLIEKCKHVEVLQRLLDSFDLGIVEFMNKLVSPDEPTAVICHGDFCRNNIIFKYSEGQPVDVKFFDLATARYASPAIDISFFLLLNSSKATRENHWDDLLKDYHQALISTLPEVDLPSLADVRNDVSRKALYGFVHCAFFLPVMVFGKPPPCPEHADATAGEETVHSYAKIGGHEGTKLLSDMVEELIQRGCIT